MKSTDCTHLFSKIKALEQIALMEARLVKLKDSRMSAEDKNHQYAVAVYDGGIKGLEIGIAYMREMIVEAGV